MRKFGERALELELSAHDLTEQFCPLASQLIIRDRMTRSGNCEIGVDRLPVYRLTLPAIVGKIR